ncbi:hypothetical protein HKBW3S06_00597 [Candidatus Hakubella thermalkaliphila]|uniref:alpha-amylase n=1 Tax=Candidatus Hakubella thermalkaliphila TaxID=2754717 RepID=A0A6V8NQ20_9ACTN|nr:alpha-amylase family glycosyl hydrolase [Candidatus Hakubella thermalkaliphila]GFP21371.1 hypothetical protein HKBW3S06_00597 [Candidatus Hakubella thermalkaliphila]
MIMVDRFDDANTANNNPPESLNLFDSTRTNWRAYWGGDLQGVERRLAYLQDMGIRGIWLSPVVDNINVFAYINQTGYHGFWARDFKRIEERFGDSTVGHWIVYSNLINSASARGIGIIKDFAPNHTSPRGTGEFGALFDNGVFVTDHRQDATRASLNTVTRSQENIFRHNGGVANWNNRWEIRYREFFDLADLNQHNNWVDRYLKDSLGLYLDRGISGIRIDASKHMDQGWLKTLADFTYARRNVFIMHEWYQRFGDEMYWDLTHFDNNDGMHVLNIPLAYVIRDVLAHRTQTMRNLEAAVTRQATDFNWNQKLVNFVDSHDKPRFLSIRNDRVAFRQALAFILTAPGIPLIYYGNEQYLHNDGVNEAGQVGGDPFNRPMMASWDTTTAAFRLIRSLAGLRQTNAALRYGLTTTRHLTDDVYVFERRFFNDVVLVAINRGVATTASNVPTVLPNGTYADHLGGLMGGTSISVSGGSIASMSLPATSVAVWHFNSTPNAPWLGSIDPTIGRAGNRVRIAGRGFGTATGRVTLTNGTVSWVATVNSWSDDFVELSVPAGITTALNRRNVDVFITTAAGTHSNRVAFGILSERQVPVVFRVENTIGTTLETVAGQHLFLTGSVPELSNWSDRSSIAVGPMLCPDWPAWFTMASVPASRTIEFKHIRSTLGGTGIWETGANHVVTTPADGVGTVVVQARR